MDEPNDPKEQRKKRANQQRRQAYEKAKAWRKQMQATMKSSPEHQERVAKEKERRRQMRRQAYLAAKARLQDKKQRESVASSAPSQTLDPKHVKLVYYDETEQCFKPNTRLPTKLSVVRE